MITILFKGYIVKVIRLCVSDGISEKLSIFPKNSVQIEYPELTDAQIKSKLKKAESDIKNNKVHSLESVKQTLINRLK